MDPLRFIQDSGTLREGLIPTMSYLPTNFNGMNNQEVPTTFDNSMRYTLWDPGCTHSINPYFKLYKQYKQL